MARKDPIVIVDYDPGWALEFEKQRRRLEPVLANVITRPLEHIGSTAVSSLASKPIIDMLAVVDDIGRAKVAATAASTVGWLSASEPHDEVLRRLSLCFPSVEHRTHHLHIVEDTSTKWREWIAFRDYLRSHPHLVEEYAELKRRLASDYGADPNERDRYRRGKSHFIARVTHEATTGT